VSIALAEVTFRYPGRDVDALHEVTCAVGPGEVLLVVGHNGAGKSTLLRLLNGILRPSAGMVQICGEDIRDEPTYRLAGRVAVTFQNPSDQLFASSVQREVEFGPRNLRRDGPAALADRALTLCGLRSVATRHPYDLLPPQRKLVAVASAIAMETPVLAFDEPSAGLSQPERLQLTAAIRALTCAGRTLLVVSHDLRTFLPLASAALVLQEGQVIFHGPTDAFLTALPRLRRTGVRLPPAERILVLARQDRP
jgi:energy-coupling factor transport system ATP-binding protein